jgi:hypothetical protein
MPPHRLGQDRAVLRPRHPFPEGSGILTNKLRRSAPSGYFAAAVDAISTATPGPMVEDKDTFFT